MPLRGRPVLVTGATGFLGGHLTSRLAADGALVRALTRSPERAARLPAVVTPVVGDVTRADTLEPAVAGCDIVFHCAVGYGRGRQQLAVNVEGTRNLALASARAGVARFVHVSSIAVYGYGLRGTVTEDTPLTADGDAYARTKTAAERAVRDVARQTGLVCAIIRPGMIYGPGSGMWTERLFRLARLSPTPFIGAGRGLAACIFVDDVVDLLLLLARHPAAAGEAFNSAPDPAPTFRDWMAAYQHLAGSRGWIALPPALLQAPLRAASAVTGGQRDLKALADMLGMMQQNVTYRTDKARTLLGWAPRVDLETGVARCAPWLRARGLLA